jgi:zinc protease
MVKALRVATALATVLSNPIAQAQVLATAPAVDRLPNGLTVVTAPTDHPGIVAYFTLVRTGSRDETEPHRSGFAHLFEHMMFRGTRTLDAQAYEHRMQSFGADNNAYTTEDYTLYTITIPARSLDALAAVEGDRFQHLFYLRPAFQTESRAVLGEYNKNSASPVNQLWETLSELAFTRHPYGHTTMGYLADIQAMPGLYDYSRQFFQRFYRPDNCTVIVVGDVQREHVLDLARRHYSAWGGRRAVTRATAEPEQTAPRSRALAWEGTSPPRMLLGYRVPPFDLGSRDSATLEVLHALAFSESSDLYQRLVVRDERLLRIESWAGELHRDSGLFTVEVTLKPETPFAEVEGAVTEELARIGRGETPADRLREVTSNLRYRMPMEAQTPSGVANLIARFLAVTGEVDGYERYHQTLGEVTAEDVARVARTVLTPARRTVVTLSPADRAPEGAVRVGPNRPAQAARRSP